MALPAIRIAILVATSVSLLAACGGSGPTSSSGGDTTPKPALGGGDPANGERLYAEMGCKGCHGAAGEKDGVGPNLFAITWDDHERAEARETILEGDLDHKPPMPSFKGKLDDAQIADILAYVSKSEGVSGGAYRDEGTGLAARLEGLRDDVHRSEKRLPPQVWRYLPTGEAAVLEALRAAVPRDMPSTLESAHHLEVALEAYRARLELAIEAARDLQPRIGVAPDSAPDLEPRHAFGALARFLHGLGVTGWELRIHEAVTSFEAIVTRRFPGARFDSPCTFARRARFRANDAPICLIVEVPPFRGSRGDAVEMRAATHVALAVPRVELSPESMLGQDIEVGDETFDGLFDVVASPEDARRVLVAEVRSALVRLAWHDVPTVAIGDGRAEIAWTYEPTRDAVEDASRALAALRKLDVDARLLAW